MRVALATDAWFPQVNGVVSTLAHTVTELIGRGYEVELVTPERFTTIPMPGYASIRLAVAPRRGVRKMLDEFAPDLLHIATEGPIGWSARRWCLNRDVPFTTSFHTRFPDYASVRTGISAERFWPVMKLFHASSRATFAATQSLACELADRGFANVHLWSRGVDPGIFRPEGPLHPSMLDLPGPVLLNVGRVAPEKNLEEFLDTRVAGSKVVVGEGPALEGLRARYPDVLFLGTLAGEELASAFRAADCFVFPSRTDTFGLVIIEALACGVPVAAYPVRGPIDILGPDGRGVNGEVSRPAGALDDDLEVAIGRALPLDRRAALDLAEFYSWEHATDQFEAGLQRACSQADGSTAVAFA